jgi:hypothetical protein
MRTGPAAAPRRAARSAPLTLDGPGESPTDAIYV